MCHAIFFDRAHNVIGSSSIIYASEIVIRWLWPSMMISGKFWNIFSRILFCTIIEKKKKKKKSAAKEFCSRNSKGVRLEKVGKHSMV